MTGVRIDCALECEDQSLRRLLAEVEVAEDKVATLGHQLHTLFERCRLLQAHLRPSEIVQDELPIERRIVDVHDVPAPPG